MKVKRGQSVVLVPYPQQGHLTPMLQLGSILHSQGFSVIVAHTELNAPNHANHPDLVFFPMNDGLEGRDNLSGSLENNKAMNENCKTPLRNYLVKMMMMDEEEIHDKLACIIYDKAMLFVDSVATQLSLPSIVLLPGSAAPFNTLITLLHQPEKYFPFQESQRLDLLPKLHPLRFKDIPLPVINNDVPDMLLRICRKITDIGSSVATIWNTIEDMESSLLSRLQEHYKVPCFPIGPFHKMVESSTLSTSLLVEDNSCIEWLDRQAPNSVVYVSLGSVVRIDEKELTEIAWGLANSEQPFLWVIRPGAVSGGFEWIDSLPKDFEKSIGERGRIIKWAPQKQVLAHPAVAGFFSHCGWNSTVESLGEGVPLICMPIQDDQTVNARYLSHVYEVGMELELIERSSIEKAVRKLIQSEQGKEMKRKAADMKQKILACCIQSDGCSRKNLNALVHFISSLPSRTSPPSAAVRHS